MGHQVIVLLHQAFWDYLVVSSWLLHEPGVMSRPLGATPRSSDRSHVDDTIRHTLGVVGSNLRRLAQLSQTSLLYMLLVHVLQLASTNVLRYNELMGVLFKSFCPVSMLL